MPAVCIKTVMKFSVPRHQSQVNETVIPSSHYPKALQFDNLPDKDKRTLSRIDDTGVIVKPPWSHFSIGVTWNCYSGLPGRRETIVVAGGVNATIETIPITERSGEGAEILVLTESSTSENSAYAH